MNIITRQQWDTEWKPIDPTADYNTAISLTEYAKKVNAHKAAWSIPFQYSSNSRYEVYIESLLEQGVAVPDSIMAGVDLHANRYKDVPLIGKRLDETR